jgi:translation initiation factor 1
MSKRKPRGDDEATQPLAKPFNNAFGGLAPLREALPDVPVKAAEKKQPSGPARAVVRYERKGRGGKEVTVVEQLSLNPKDLERWVKELKSALGCGGKVDEGALVLQGDQRERLPALLEARGVRRVSVG